MRRVLPQSRWVTIVVAPADGSAGGHGGARAELGRGARGPEIAWKRPGGTEAVCRGRWQFRSMTVPEKKEKPTRAGGEKHGSMRAERRQISKRGARRSSGRCSLPECVRGGGYRRQAFTAGVVPGGSEARCNDEVRAELEHTRGEFSHSLNLVNSPLSL